MSKNLVRVGVAVLTAVLAVIVLWQFRTIVGYVLLSLMLAAAIRPFFRRLEGRKLLVRIAWGLVYLVLMCGFIFGLFLVIKGSASDLQELAKSVSVQDKWALPLWTGSSLQQIILTRLPSPSVLFQAIIGNEGELVLPALFGVAQGVGTVATAVTIILILSIYWGINQIHFERLWLSLLPSDQRKRARGIWRTIEPEIGIYLRGQVFQSITVGLILGLAYWLLGSPYPVLLAFIGALLCLIPVVGPVLAVLTPLLVGLFTSVQVGLLTGSFTLVVFIALIIWIKPRFIKPKWDNPILSVLLLIAMGDGFGVLGIILAPPASVICQILWNRLVSHRVAAGAAFQYSDLKERLDQLKETVTLMEEPRLPLITSSLERVSSLLAEAEPVLSVLLPVDPSETLPSPQ